MSVRHKNWAAGDQLKAADMNTVANNGVVQVDTIAELTDVFDNQLGVNVVFCLEDMKLYSRGNTEFGPAGVSGAAMFDEASGTVGTYFDKTVDDKTYRTVEFLADGTFVLQDGGGFVSWWLGSAGGSGGTYNGTGNLGAGGGHGAVWEMHDYYLPAGTYTVTIGQPGSTASAQGGATVITPQTPVGNIVTSFSCRGGSGGSGSAGAGPNTQYPFADATTQGGITRVTDSQPYYTGGTPASGYGGGAAGLGGGVTGRMGGPALTITGWALEDFDYGKGGSSQYGSDPVVDNCGYGGDGDHANTFSNGSSGRAYIRVQI